MPIESTNKEDKKIVGDGEKDSLQKAADQISEVDDDDLALMFMEANKKASTEESAELVEIYSEQEEHYEFEDHKPNPLLLKAIGDSLKNKDFHHKRLLEDDAPTSFFSWILFKIKKFFLMPTNEKQLVNLTSLSWKKYLFNQKIWRKKKNLFFADFSSFLELKLRDNSKVKKILKYEILFCFLAFFLNFLILFNFPNIFSKNIANKFSFFENWKNLIFFFSLFSLIFIIIPPLFFMTLWFVNVNFLHTSKNFHFFVFGFFTISYFFLFLTSFNILIFFIFNNYFSFSTLDSTS